MPIGQSTVAFTTLFQPPFALSRPLPLHALKHMPVRLPCDRYTKASHRALVSLSIQTSSHYYRMARVIGGRLLTTDATLFRMLAPTTRFERAHAECSAGSCHKG
ncbi:hypothetical protein IE81DRAFT_240375 [Ceraceosorus guamensis]|uniref:Uncharacterized protein n=1 Tax=Ceraceosorus guamensis TaxID=1522189 RepID=A0A316WA35_9BASI|nr:hypothetical protein IE81DRAFT_240375 [Ceraceosorus guamensis]PWN44843.1 hypothetical protein IE81DRAFT_240375 [Ceraceosorus guamensis]